MTYMAQYHRGTMQILDALAGELEQIDSNLQRLSSRLANEDFLSKAPAQVVEKERGRLSDMEDRRARVEETLSRLGG